ncbi:MAG: hypothetical protein U1F77_14390 [Kiritimatiellia bacterium]
MKKLLLSLPLAVLASAGCDDADGEFSHKAPAGQGSLIVDNRTTARFEVFVDGEKLARVGSNNDRAFDLQPGVHRVVIDEDDGRRGEGNDVDILEGRLTVLRIQSDFSDSSELDLDIYLDN